MENKTLGQKIEYYRKRAKMSQLDLEIAIGAGQGSISRIENDQVNPTKETLQKIVKQLKLKSYEINVLFDINRDDFPNLIRVANQINNELDLDVMLNIATNSLKKVLDISGVAIFIANGDYLYPAAVDNETPNRKWLINYIGDKAYSFKFSMKLNTTNIVVRSVKEQKALQTFNGGDFARDFLPESVIDELVKKIGIKSGIVFPMIKNKEIIGAVMYMKLVKEGFELEFDILEAFTDYIATTVINIKKIESVKKNGK